MQFNSNSLTIDPLLLNRLMRAESLARMVTYLRRITLAVAALLVIYLFQQGIASILAVSSETANLENAAALEVNATTPAKSKKVTTDYSLLKRSQIFGAFEARAKAAPTEAKPLSTLALNLIGTFITAGESPYAIIEDDRKKIQDVFNLQDRIFNEAKLVAIYSDRVDIERNGKIEVLKLDRAPGKEGSTPQTSGISEINSDEFVVDEGELNRAIENLPLVLTQARAVPYFKDGRSVGLRMFAIRTGSIFEKIGLKNGDILKSVNGQSLADLTQAVKLFEKLKEERSVNVVLERDRQDRDFKYQIR
jgi:general secretion pathway protein C